MADGVEATKKAAYKAAFLWPSGLLRRLFDALAERIADEAGDGDRRADPRLRLLDRLGDALGGIVDVGLIEQAHLLVESLEAGLDDLVDDVGGLAGVLLGEHRAFALNERRIDAAGVERDRARGGDVHRDLPPEGDERVASALRLEGGDDADPAEALDYLAVHILADRPLGDPQALDAAQGHVLADRGDGVGDRLGDRA